MRKHQETHLDPQRFKCEFTRCNAAFVNSDELEQHFKDIHEGLKPFTCHWYYRTHITVISICLLFNYYLNHRPNCHKQCSSKLNLQKHHYSHKEPKKFKCQWTDCNESYVKRNQLMAHECKAHTGIETHFVYKFNDLLKNLVLRYK